MQVSFSFDINGPREQFFDDDDYGNFVAMAPGLCIRDTLVREMRSTFSHGN